MLFRYYTSLLPLYIEWQGKKCVWSHPCLLYFKIRWYSGISQKQKLIRCRGNATWLSWTGITNLIYLIISQPQTETSPLLHLHNFLVQLWGQLYLLYKLEGTPCYYYISVVKADAYQSFLGFPLSPHPPRIHSALDCRSTSVSLRSSCQTPSVPQSWRIMKGNFQPGSVCAFFN